jgi:hypothetical protein
VLPIVPVAVATVLMAAITLVARELLEDHVSQAAALASVVALGIVSYAAALRIVAPSLLDQAIRDLRTRTH